MHTRLSFHVYMAETGERLTRACNTLIYMTLYAVIYIAADVSLNKLK